LNLSEFRCLVSCLARHLIQARGLSISSSLLS
jgi:hypothetical protein